MKHAGRIVSLGCLAAGGLVLMALAGCSASDFSTRDDMSDMFNGQSKALADPFDYSPDMSQTDVSGGGTSNLDSKGLNRDLNDVANP